MITVEVVDTGDRVQRALERLLEATGDKREVEKALLTGAFVLEGEAKTNVQRMKAIDTGFMLNSIYSAIPKESGYKDARRKALSSASGREMADEVKPDDWTAVVAVGAEYSIHVEYGTSRMQGRPFLRRAVANKRDEAAEAVLDAVVRKIGWGR